MTPTPAALPVWGFLRSIPSCHTALGSSPARCFPGAPSIVVVASWLVLVFLPEALVLNQQVSQVIDFDPVRNKIDQAEQRQRNDDKRRERHSCQQARPREKQACPPAGILL